MEAVSEYLTLDVELPIDTHSCTVQVKMEDEGIVLDVFAYDSALSDTDVVASTWKLYDEFGKDVRASGPWMVPFDEIVDSFRVALRAQTELNDHDVESVIATVTDAAVNHLGDD